MILTFLALQSHWWRQHPASCPALADKTHWTPGSHSARCACRLQRACGEPREQQTFTCGSFASPDKNESTSCNSKHFIVGLHQDLDMLTCQVLESHMKRWKASHQMMHWGRAVYMPAHSRCWLTSPESPGCNQAVLIVQYAVTVVDCVMFEVAARTAQCCKG